MTCDDIHDQGGWRDGCVPSADQDVPTLVGIIRAAPSMAEWPLARHIRQQWPARRLSLPEALRQEAATPCPVVEDIMGLLDGYNLPAAVLERVRSRLVIVYGAGMVAGRASRQEEINTLQGLAAQQLARAARRKESPR